jgi:uncharacterized protein YbdZ (MbtH family)
MANRPDENASEELYRVVINDEEQYSIWPEQREIPLGWRAVGSSAPKAQCLARIQEVWTDMRPLSLRKKMEEERSTPPPEPQPMPPYESLVDRLTASEDHPVEAVVSPPEPSTLEQKIREGFVYVRFTGTRGGTELGLALDTARTDISRADFRAGTGFVRMEGSLTVDFEPVTCNVQLDLATLKGTGGLRRVPAGIGASIS